MTKWVSALPRRRVSGPYPLLPNMRIASAIRSRYGRVPLFLSRAAPDAVDLAGAPGEGQAFTPDRTVRTDRFRRGDLGQAPARIRDREEQFRIGGPAGGRCSPVSQGQHAQRSG